MSVCVGVGVGDVLRCAALSCAVLCCAVLLWEPTRVSRRLDIRPTGGWPSRAHYTLLLSVNELAHIGPAVVAANPMWDCWGMWGVGGRMRRRGWGVDGGWGWGPTGVMS